ncbi:MAG TPA: GAF domain-containing protein, partial [Cytophagales bacterium]|nr:GAF domain-containing protein [Cytophagales bacterium]
MSLASIFSFTMLVLHYLAIGKNHHLDLLLFRISNPFLLIVVFVVPLLYALVYMAFTLSDDKDRIIENHDELLQSKSTQQIIEEEIQNRYQDKIDLVVQSMSTKSDSETEQRKKLEKALWAFCSELSMSQGLLYTKVEGSSPVSFQLASSYAYIGSTEKINKFELGVGINGQVAYSGEPIFLDKVPHDYLKVVSGLGESHPTLLLIIPIKNTENQVIALLEVSGFGSLNAKEVQSIY